MSASGIAVEELVRVTEEAFRSHDWTPVVRAAWNIRQAREEAAA